MHLPTLPQLASVAHNWSVESQQVARRNAMLAATQCAQRRAERQDVDDYFAAMAGAQAPSSEPAVRSAQR